MVMLTSLKCCFSASRPLLSPMATNRANVFSELMAGESPGASGAHSAGVVVQPPGNRYAAGVSGGRLPSCRAPPRKGCRSPDRARSPADEYVRRERLDAPEDSPADSLDRKRVGEGKSGNGGGRRS